MSGEVTGSKHLQQRYETRSLEEDVRELIPYLRKKMSVLDVGCGPGSITLGVAQAVRPGRVTGIDVMPDRIQSATDAASRQRVKNVSFEPSDAHNLRFADGSFDLVYSNTVLHSLIDPMRALSEQKRVVKPGGWVIACGVRDWGFSPRYPPCPALQRLHDAWIRYHEKLQSRYLAGEVVAGAQRRQLGEFQYIDLNAARKCVRWFSETGLRNLNISYTAGKIEYPGADRMDAPSVMCLVPPHGVSDDPLWDVYRDIVAEGLIAESSIDRARDEIETWYRHPHAFHIWGRITIAGQV